MTEEQYRKLLDNLPREHHPAPYEVRLCIPTGRHTEEKEAVRYVRATSPARARVAALHINKTLFRGKAKLAYAKPMMPVKPLPNSTAELEL